MAIACEKYKRRNVETTENHKKSNLYTKIKENATLKSNLNIC